MVSAIFRRSQAFFKKFGWLQRSMLRMIDHFFVQDEQSAILLSSIGISNVTVSGDTRFDRVRQNAQTVFEVPVIQKFCEESVVLVAGSTWSGDEPLLVESMKQVPSLKVIIAPHEINDGTIDRLQKKFPAAALLSESDVTTEKRTMIIDRIGLLAFLYRYGSITYVGGGFDRGIHNLLEAAAYGRPVLFGPKHQKFLEAKNLLESGGGFSVNGADEFIVMIKKMIEDKQFYTMCCINAKEFVNKGTGATQKVLEFIQIKRLLTN